MAGQNVDFGSTFDAAGLNALLEGLGSVDDKVKILSKTLSGMTKGQKDLEVTTKELVVQLDDYTEAVIRLDEATGEYTVTARENGKKRIADQEKEAAAIKKTADAIKAKADAEAKAAADALAFDQRRRAALEQIIKLNKIPTDKTVQSEGDLNKFLDAQNKAAELMAKNVVTARDIKIMFDNLASPTAPILMFKDEDAQELYSALMKVDVIRQKLLGQTQKQIDLNQKNNEWQRELVATEQRQLALKAKLIGFGAAQTSTASGLPVEGVTQATTDKLNSGLKAIYNELEKIKGTAADFDRIWSAVEAGAKTNPLAIEFTEAFNAARKLHSIIPQIAMDEEAYKNKMLEGLEVQKKLNAEIQRRNDLAAFTAKISAPGIHKEAKKEDVLAYNRALEQANRLAEKHEVDLATIESMWKDIQAGGSVSKYSGHLLEVENAFRKVDITGRKTLNGLYEETQKANKLAKEFTVSFETINRMLTVHAGYAALGALQQGLSQSFDVATQLSIRLAEVQTITQNNAVSSDIWKEKLIGLSNAFGIPVLEQVEGAYQAISNQVVDSTNAIQFMTEANKLAIATNATVDQSVSALSSVINAFGLQNEDVSKLSAILFKTVELGRVRLDEMANTLGRSAVTAGELGVSFEELAAQIAMLTVKGFPFEHAQTQILGLMQGLLKPTKEMEKAIRSWGYTTGQEVIAAEGFAGAMKKITEYSNGNLTVMSALIPRVRGLSEALAFLGDGAKDYEKILTQIADSQEYFDRAVKLSLENTGRNIKQQQEQFKNAFLGFAEESEKAIVAFTHNVMGMEAAGRTMAFAFEALVIPAIAAMVFALRGLGKSLMISGPVGIAIAGIGLLSAGIFEAVKAITRSEEDLTKELYKNWYERYQLMVDTSAEAHKKIVTETTKAIKEIDKEILKSQARINAASIKSLEETFKIIQNQGVYTSKALKGIDFDFSDSFKPVFKSLEKSISSSDKAINKYKKSIEKADDAIRDIELSKSKFKFEIEMAGLDKFPTVKDITSLSAELYKLHEQYVAQANNLKGQKDTLNKINSLETLRINLVKGQIAQNKIDELEKIGKKLGDQLVIYEETKDKISELNGIIALGGDEQERIAEAKKLLLNLTAREAEINKQLTGENQVTDRLQRNALLVEQQSNRETMDRAKLEAQTNEKLEAQIASLQKQANLYGDAKLLADQNAKQIDEATKKMPAYQNALERVNRIEARRTELLGEIEKFTQAGDEGEVAKRIADYTRLSAKEAELISQYRITNGIKIDENEIANKALELEENVRKVATDRLAAEEERHKRLLSIQETTKESIKTLDSVKTVQEAINDPKTNTEERVRLLKKYIDAMRNLQGLRGEEAQAVKELRPELMEKFEILQKELAAQEKLLAVQTTALEQSKKITALEEQRANAATRITELEKQREDFVSRISKEPQDVLSVLSGNIAVAKKSLAARVSKLDEAQNAPFSPERMALSAERLNLDKLKGADALGTRLQDAATALTLAQKGKNIEAVQTASETYIGILKEGLTLAKTQGNTEIGKNLTGYFENLIAKFESNRVTESMQELDTLRQTYKNTSDDLITMKQNLAGFMKDNQITIVNTFGEVTNQTNLLAIAMKSAADMVGGFTAAVQTFFNERSLLVNPETGKPYATGGQVEYFASGGRPRGTDIVPAMLTPGEFVVNKTQAMKWLPLLKLLNEGKLTSLMQGSGSSTFDKLSKILISLQGSGIRANAASSMSGYNRNVDQLVKMTNVDNLGSLIGKMFTTQSFNNAFSNMGNNFRRLAGFQYGGPVRPTIRGYADGGSVTNVGDVNVTMNSSGNPALDVQQLGRLLQREIRRGTVRFA